MRIELTVNGPGDVVRDVAVVAPGQVELGAITAGLVGDASLGSGATLWSDDRALPPTARVGGNGLRTGAVLSVGGPIRTVVPPGVLALHQIGGPRAGRVVAVGRGSYVLGRGPECDVVLDDPDASRRHAVLTIGPGAITIADCASTNGTTVDGQAIEGARSLRPGQHIRIGDSTMVVVGPADSPATVHATPDGSIRIVRSPRITTRVRGEQVVLPQRPSGGRPRGVQWVAALLPAAAGGAIAWFAHSAQFLLFALLSPVMMLATSLGDRAHWRRSRRLDAAAYRSRLAAAQAAVSGALVAETTARHAAGLDPAALLRCARMPGRRLWERRRGDPDATLLRVGTSDIESTTTVRTASGARPAGTLRAVPVEIGLRAGPLGVCGPRATTDGVSRWLVGQLAALHSPADLVLALLLSPEREAEWQWARWLPHVQTRVAVDPGAWTALVGVLQETISRRLTGLRSAATGWSGPWWVLVVDGASRLVDVPGLADVLARGAQVGITAVCLEDLGSGLPASCATVLTVHGVTGTRGTVRDGDGVLHDQVVLDSVDAAWAETLARSLAPYTDPGDDGTASVPASCRLLESLDADDLDPGSVLQRWSAADRSGRHAATPIGFGADGRLTLDLVTDGPHALVAGTTGAGKSELLQTLVAGLATNHPPDDVTFLLIDYKGGAAFAECARLPHTAGLVTDLDPYLTRRALRSLDSELRRRERLFAAAGAGDLAGYRSTAPAVAEPLARLVIVVDEFAALAEELPDFVRGLVGVAQRGRSLGIHLVLATQRPGTAVSPEIRANTSLRIALRVTDPGESCDIVGIGDAAAIDRGIPGRGVLRTGDAVVAFQTGFAGAVPVDPSQVVVEELGPWRRPAGATGSHGDTELAKLVAAVVAAAERGGYASAVRPWLPPLPDRIAHDEIDVNPGHLPFGVVDLPDEQRCTPITIDLRAGTSLLLAGTGRTGRSTSLAAVALAAAERYAPGELHVYVIDPSGALSSAIGDLPQCATVLGPDDIDNAALLLRRLGGVCGDALAARRQSSSARPPLGLLLIDDWAGLHAALSDVDALDCADRLADVLRNGPAAGMSTVLAGDRSVLVPRISSGFAARYLLRQSDQSDFGLAGLAPREVPPQLLPGRGVRAVDGAVVHLAHAGRSPDLDAAHVDAQRIARRWSSATAGPGEEIRLRALPRSVALVDVAHAGRWVLGVGGDSADALPFVPFSPDAGPARMLVAGPPRSGRSTLLCSLLRQSIDAGVVTLVAAGGRSPVATLARRHDIPVMGPSADVGSIPMVPGEPTLVLVDDCELFLDCPAADALVSWTRSSESPVAIVVAGRNDDLATTYRGIGAHVRRHNTGVLLRPGPADGELLGVRLPRRPSTGPPGRGVVVGDPAWGECYRDGEPVPVQIAIDLPVVGQPMCG